jgi:hypothetical protein
MDWLKKIFNKKHKFTVNPVIGQINEAIPKTKLMGFIRGDKVQSNASFYDKLHESIAGEVVGFVNSPGVLGSIVAVKRDDNTIKALNESWLIPYSGEKYGDEKTETTIDDILN